MNQCFLSKKDEESIDYILCIVLELGCFWNLVFSLFGIIWAMTSLVRETLLGCMVLLWAKYERSRGCVYFEHYGRRGTREHLKAKKCLVKH